MAASAVLRLPRSWPAFEFALAGVRTRLRPGAPVLVHGARDEGIQSAPRRMESSLTGVETVANARRCRVLRGIVPATDPPGAAPAGGALELDRYREVGRVNLGWGELPWVSYPGTFARGGIDGGTRLLLEHLPAFEPGARILDFAAGTGVVARAVLQADPRARVHVVEPDALARLALAENLGWATEEMFARVRSAWEWDGEPAFRLILSNPPYHVGKDESLEVIEGLVSGAARALEAKGQLRIVVQRRLPVQELLEASFRTVTAVADEGPYRVWSAAGAVR
jgi:16S rRNA (guanine1207-N2)-methyltransferase